MKLRSLFFAALLAACSFSAHAQAPSTVCVVAAELQGGSDDAAVSDAQGNTWLKGAEVNTGIIYEAWYALNCTVPAAVSVKQSTPAPHSYIGLVASFPNVTGFDASASAKGQSLTATVGPLTTANANELLVGAFLESSFYNLTDTPGTGFTLVNSNYYGLLSVESMTAGNAGAYSASLSWSGTSGPSWGALLMAFKTSASAPPSYSFPGLGTGVGFTATILGLVPTCGSGDGPNCALTPQMCLVPSPGAAPQCLTLQPGAVATFSIQKTATSGTSTAMIVNVTSP